MYFNPRSHEGSDPNGFGSVYKLSDFNPRSHEGSDLKSHRKPVIQLYFNPRSHEGSDYPAPFTIATTPDISIHAPTRGATMFCLVMHLSSRFQSTLPRGERHINLEMPEYTFEFQSTLPRGERHSGQWSGASAEYFNPRSHEGSDSAGAVRGRAYTISIHAPTRGATQTMLMDMLRSGFQSTLPRGERPEPADLAQPTTGISIHAPTRGATALQAYGLIG